MDNTSLNLDLSHLPTYLTNPALLTHALAKNTQISAQFGKNCFFYVMCRLAGSCRPVNLKFGKCEHQSSLLSMELVLTEQFQNSK